MRNEHPKPDLVHESGYLSLNGKWQFALDDDGSVAKSDWLDIGVALPRQIEVPFAPECALSGIADPSFHDHCYYKTAIEIKKKTNRSYRLTFLAVDYETKDDKTEEKSLTKEGAFSVRAEKINLNATDTEGKATGSIAANAKAVEVKTMDVDKEKRTDKSLAAGSTLLLLAEKVYAGSRDKKTKSKSVQVASDKVGLFGDTTVEFQQDGKAILQLSGGNASLSGGKTTFNEPFITVIGCL